MGNLKRKSKWTAIYWDFNEAAGKLLPHVRLVPRFMDCEGAGRPHGLSIGGPRESEEDAIKFADSVDAFMDAIIAELPKHNAKPATQWQWEEEGHKCCVCGTTENVKWIGGDSPWKCPSLDCVAF